LVQNLLIAAYAIQTDKAWLRAGKPIPEPGLTAIADDMALRSQELPSEDEFEKASQRAHGIFGIARQPVRNARSVQVLADAIRRGAEGRQSVALDLADELGKHSATLGLDTPHPDGGQPRTATSRILVSLLPKLAGTTDPTETLRVLAAADLPKDNAFYQAHLKSAEQVTGTLRTRNWDVLDQFAAAEGDAEAFTIISALQEAARHDEHEVALAERLRNANEAAISLAMSRMQRPPTPGPSPAGADTPGSSVTGSMPAGQTTSAAPLPSPERIRARDVAALVEKICEAADENPGAEFEITWRIVEN
jgi:hypothetical protein